jgi:hypothetical protein
MSMRSVDDVQLHGARGSLSVPVGLVELSDTARCLWGLSLEAFCMLPSSDIEFVQFSTRSPLPTVQYGSRIHPRLEVDMLCPVVPSQKNG